MWRNSTVRHQIWWVHQLASAKSDFISISWLLNIFIHQGVFITFPGLLRLADRQNWRQLKNVFPISSLVFSLQIRSLRAIINIHLNGGCVAILEINKAPTFFLPIYVRVVDIYALSWCSQFTISPASHCCLHNFNWVKVELDERRVETLLINSDSINFHYSAEESQLWSRDEEKWNVSRKQYWRIQEMLRICKREETGWK